MAASTREAAADALADDRVSPALRAAVEAHRDATLAMLLSPDNSDEAGDRLTAAVAASGAALCAVQARSIADVRAKLAFLLPEILPDMISVSAGAFIKNVFDDVERLAAPLDLSAVSIRDLARYYDHRQGLAHIASMACNAPMGWNDTRENWSPLGPILEAEADRLDELAAHVADEIRARKPRSDDERDDRLATIVKRAIALSPDFEDPDLAAEVNRAWGC